MTPPLLVILTGLLVSALAVVAAYALRSRWPTWASAARHRRLVSAAIAWLPPLVVVAANIEANYSRGVLVDDGILVGSRSIGVFPVLTFTVVTVVSFAAAFIREFPRTAGDPDQTDTPAPSA